jgi:hypothetical protein
VSAQTVAVPPLKKIAAITGFFSAVGPPLGWLVLCFGVSLLGSVQAAFTEHPTENLIHALLLGIMSGIFGVPPSYLFGIVPAFLAGLIIGILHVHHRSNYFSVLAAGICVGSGYAVALRTYLSNHFLPNQVEPLWPIGLTSVVTTFLCWRGVRNWYLEDMLLDGGQA